MPDPFRDPFGKLLIQPEALPREERILCLRKLGGELQAAKSLEAQWLGRVLVEWLGSSADLEHLLGVRGSRNRVERLARREARDQLLVQLANTVGGAARATRVLQGMEPVPSVASRLVEQLRSMGAPRSLRTFSRARSASRNGR